MPFRRRLQRPFQTKPSFEMCSTIIENKLRVLLEAAVLAPSGDNTQPWRFVVDERDRTIEIHVDPTRDQSPMNSGQRMARIACGAAIENVERTARFNDWPLVATTESHSALTAFQLRGAESSSGNVDPLIVQRVTNRRFYNRVALEAGFIRELERDILAPAGLDLRWTGHRSEIDRMAAIIGRADREMFGREAMRRAFLENVRFDLAADAVADDGLSLGSLALRIGESWGLRMLRRLPNRIIHYTGVLRSLERKSRQLVESASGLCAIFARDWATSTDIAIGRLFQQIWLALTKHGLAVQPMMSLPVLQNHDRGEVAYGQSSSVVEDLLGNTHDMFGQPLQSRLAAILRFGHAAPPASRTGRRPIDDVWESRGRRQLLSMATG